MSKHTWKLLDLMALGDSNVSYFAINTNLNSKESLIEKLIQKAKTIRGLHIYSSNESMGEKAEYIRDGLNWNMWVKNFNKIAESKSFSSMHSMCTIGALSLEGLVDYLDWCLEIKQKANSSDAVTFTLNILRFPNFQSCLILPRELRQRFADELTNWLSQNRNSHLLHAMEVEQVERLIEYLKNESNQIKDRDKVVKWFKNYFVQYDKRRGKNFEKTFPIIGEWYRGI